METVCIADKSFQVEKKEKENFYLFQSGEMKAAASKKHSFWNTQPIPNRFGGEESAHKLEEVEGEFPAELIDPEIVSKASKEPFPLPERLNIEWMDCSEEDERSIAEMVYELSLRGVDQSTFNFAAQPDFLLWSMQPPDMDRRFQMAFRDKSSKRVQGFFCALPFTVSVNGRVMKSIEAKNLFVDPSLRGNHLAPLLIDELTRRVRLYGGFEMGFYTAATTITKPIATTRYFKRVLCYERLVQVGFKKLRKHESLIRESVRYNLPERPSKGFRSFVVDDSDEALSLLNEYSKKFKIHQIMNEREFHHWFVKKPEYVHSFVVEKEGKIVAFSSYYILSANTKSVAGKKMEIRAAFLFYSAVIGDQEDYKQIIKDTLIAAKNVTIWSKLLFPSFLTLVNKNGIDLFMSLNFGDNEQVVNEFFEMKWEVSEEYLLYHIYNFKVKPIEPSAFGLNFI